MPCNSSTQQNRPSRRRDWKSGNESHDYNPSPELSTPMAPVAVSSQSKSKLRAFQYDERKDHTTPKAADTEKENRDPEVDATVLKMDPPLQPLSQRSETKDIRDCPQTPVGRLPLTQLLASGDDTSRQHLNLTPIERVLWDNSPVSSEPSHTRRKGRKRAHSSSPASSSQNDTSRHFESTRPQADIQALQKVLKTPKADPADDLWSRYSLNTGTVERRSPTAPNNLAFSQLIHSSSPQTPASHLQNRDGNGLRRALSCIEWPTSAAKRRKLQRNGVYKDSNSGLTRIGVGANTNEVSMMSRVSFLVEKIHDGLTKPQTADGYSSSELVKSSPVARKINGSPNSPSREGQRVMDDIVTVLSQTAVAPKEHKLLPLVLSAEEIADLEKADGSSDFGDNDLDLEMLETVDPLSKVVSTVDGDAAMPKQIRSQSKAERAITATPIDCIRSLHQPSTAQADSGDPAILAQVCFPSEISSSAEAAAPQQDEFDEDEDEVSAADLENMFAQYDTQPGQHLAKDQIWHAKQADALHPGSATELTTDSRLEPKPLIATHIVLSDDEDFGDVSDFEQIAAECAEATQNQQVSQRLSSVRIVYYGSSIS